MVQIQSRLFEIYGSHNSYYNLNEFCCILHRLQAHMAKADGDKESIHRLAIRAFAWLCGVASQFGTDLKQNLYAHFPGICPYCGHEVCDGTKVKRMPITTAPTNMSWMELAEMLAKIYPKNTLSKSIEKLGEEVSELPFTKGVGQSFYEELADVTARLLAIVYLVGTHKTFEQDLFDRFKNGCPSCQQPKCAGPFFLEPRSVGSVSGNS